MTIEFTRGQYYYRLLILHTWSSRAGTAERECALRYPGRRHPDSNVLRRLGRLREAEV
jgi:hypothetical protein